MNQIAKQEPSFTEEQRKLIKSMYFRDSTDDEFIMFLHVCKKTGLDPTLKQIHAVKRSTRQSDGSYKMQMTVQTGIDGYRLIAERTGRYAPGREPTFTYDANKRLISATSYVKKQTPDGTWHEVSATAFFDEYCQKDKNQEPTSFWKKMAHSQLAKCAEALALRKAFPGDLSSVYTNEEMDQAQNNGMIVEERKIEESQVKELRSLLMECPKEYAKNLWNLLKTQKKVEKLEDISVDYYETLKGAIMKKLSESREEALAS